MEEDLNPPSPGFSDLLAHMQTEDAELECTSQGHSTGLSCHHASSLGTYSNMASGITANPLLSRPPVHGFEKAIPQQLMSTEVDPSFMQPLTSPQLGLGPNLGSLVPQSASQPRGHNGPGGHPAAHPTQPVFIAGVAGPAVQSSTPGLAEMPAKRRGRKARPQLPDLQQQLDRLTEQFQQLSQENGFLRNKLRALECVMPYRDAHVGFLAAVQAMDQQQQQLQQQQRRQQRQQQQQDLATEDSVEAQSRSSGAVSEQRPAQVPCYGSQQDLQAPLASSPSIPTVSHTVAQGSGPQPVPAPPPLPLPPQPPSGPGSASAPAAPLPTAVSRGTFPAGPAAGMAPWGLAATTLTEDHAARPLHGSMAASLSATGGLPTSSAHGEGAAAVVAAAAADAAAPVLHHQQQQTPAAWPSLLASPQLGVAQSHMTPAQPGNQGPALAAPAAKGALVQTELGVWAPPAHPPGTPMVLALCPGPDGDVPAIGPAAVEELRRVNAKDFRALWRHITLQLAVLVTSAETFGLRSPQHARLDRFLQRAFAYIDRVFLLSPNCFYDNLYINVETGEQERPSDDFWVALGDSMNMTPQQEDQVSTLADLYEQNIQSVIRERARLASELSTRIEASERYKKAGDSLQALAAVDELAEKLRRNVLKEQQAQWDIGDFLCYSVLTPLQLGRVMTAAYPFIPDGIAIMHAMKSKRQQQLLVQQQAALASAGQL